MKTQQANLENNKISWDRGQELYSQGLIPKQDFDTRKTLYDGSVAAVASAQAKIPQCRANVEQALHFVEQNKAQVVHTDDVLNKTTYRAPIDGVVTYISVREGENMVPGIQNSTGSYMMTISDMSIVTSEVMVDETDIINIRAGQAATITVDALPGQTFTGHVTEVGSQAVLTQLWAGLHSVHNRFAGSERFQSCRDAGSPSPGLRQRDSPPRRKLSPRKKDDVLAIPIQALAVRSRKQLEDAAQTGGIERRGGCGVTLAAAKPDHVHADASKKTIFRASSWFAMAKRFLFRCKLEFLESPISKSPAVCKRAMRSSPAATRLCVRFGRILL